MEGKESDFGRMCMKMDVARSKWNLNWDGRWV